MVTVIIPAYNRGEDLRQALYSLSAQTIKDFNVLVSDDAGAEDLSVICDEFKDILHLTYLRSKQNRGCGGNRAFALEYFLAHNPTEYVMFLDSDDLLFPHAIERMEQIIRYNQADIIITNIRQETDSIEPKTILAEKSRTWLHGKCYNTQFFIDNKINFPISLKTNEDLAFNLSLYAYEPESYLVDEEIYYFRNNPYSITKNTQRLQACTSTDYIEAIYFAYLHYKVQNAKLSNLMISNIINIYEYYQRGIIYKTLTEKNKQHVRKMIRDPEVASIIVQIYAHPEYDFKFKQWAVKDDTLSFFGQTFGSWIMSFFKMEEIRELINQNGLRKNT